MANVSSGTVDRVLHNRGKVSLDKEERVNKILKEIDFRPNQFARSLKLNKRYRFVVLMPSDELDEYWKPCFSGVEELMDSMEERGISTEILKYSPNDPNDFIIQANVSVDLKPDGVLLGALFLNESKQFLKTLDENKIPFNLINTAVEGTNYHTFVGHSLIESGRTAAHLFDSILPEKKSLLIVHVEETFENAFHMQQKEIGFRSYFEDKGTDVQLQTINIKTTESKEVVDHLKDKLRDKINGIFVTTSKSYLVVGVGIDPEIPIIGYDLLVKNVHYLKNGKIRFLIHQNPKLQAFEGLSLLSDYITKSTSNPKEKFLPIEIISPENVDSYSEFLNL